MYCKCILNCFTFTLVSGYTQGIEIFVEQSYCYTQIFILLTLCDLPMLFQYMLTFSLLVILLFFFTHIAFRIHHPAVSLLLFSV